jgi:hypothetical protein
MSDEERYDPEELERLWKLDYDKLAMDPGRSGRLREARFVMQAKVALETRSLIKYTFWMMVGTFALAIATIVLAIVTVVKDNHP